MFMIGEMYGLLHITFHCLVQPQRRLRRRANKLVNNTSSTGTWMSVGVSNLPPHGEKRETYLVLSCVENLKFKLAFDLYKN